MSCKKPDVTIKELAYIAGFIDGEGCIQANSSGRLVVQVGNTVKAPLQLIQDIFGGSVRLYARDKKEEHKPVYRYAIGSLPAIKMLTMLLPYLIVKREQAVLGIALNDAPFHKRVDIAVKLRILKH